MLSAWPNATNDPPNYIGALAAVLRQYPRCVAAKCADPVRGVARTTKYRPTVADLGDWCDREVAGLREIVDLDDRLVEQAKQRGEATKLEQQVAEQRKQRPTLGELRAKWGKNWGLDAKPPESPRHEKLEARAAISRETAILQEYARLGLEPVYAGDMLISPTLRKQIEDRRGT